MKFRVPPQRHNERTQGFRVFSDRSYKGNRIECNYCLRHMAEHAFEEGLKFWVEMKLLAPELSVQALRLFHTPANSVPS
jgi:hypothetical protein